MKRSSILMVFVLAVTGFAASAAEDPVPAKPATDPAVAAAKAAKSDTPAAPESEAAAATAAKPSQSKEEKDAAKSPADKSASPQRFVPSEQVRPDFDVSFPIDI